jgi:hypothetical protein
MFENDETKDDEDDLFKSPQHQISLDKDQKDYTPHTSSIQKPRSTKRGSSKRRVLSKRTSIMKMATTEEIESWFNE